MSQTIEQKNEYIRQLEKRICHLRKWRIDEHRWSNQRLSELMEECSESAYQAREANKTCMDLIVENAKLIQRVKEMEASMDD